MINEYLEDSLNERKSCAGCPCLTYDYDCGDFYFTCGKGYFGSIKEDDSMLYNPPCLGNRQRLGEEDA